MNHFLANFFGSLWQKTSNCMVFTDYLKVWWKILVKDLFHKTCYNSLADLQNWIIFTERAYFYIYAIKSAVHWEKCLQSDNCWHEKKNIYRDKLMVFMNSRRNSNRLMFYLRSCPILSYFLSFFFWEGGKRK